MSFALRDKAYDFIINLARGIRYGKRYVCAKEKLDLPPTFNVD